MIFSLTASPIKTADSKVKIYACKKATNISIRNIKSTNATDIGATDQPAIALTHCLRQQKLVILN